MSTPMTMTNCPDDNTLAAYIDGRLDPAARQRVIEHLSTCEDCYANVSAVWDYQADQAKSSTNVVEAAGRFGSRPAWTWAAAVAASVLIFVVALPTIRGWVEFQRTGGMSKVIKAQRSLANRTMEGRLAGLEYKSYKSPTRGGKDGEGQEAPIEFESVDMLVAEDELKTASSVKEKRALAAAQLFVKHRNEAIMTLESAAAAAPRDLAILNDRVVAYLARGSETDNKRALELVQRAWQIEQTPEIAFNRALALERNGRDAEAIRAWQEYLALDPSSQWAAEAQAKLNNLQNPDNP